MSDEFSRPQVMECPSCGATLAVPNADTFLCDYCGKRVVIPGAYRSQTAVPQKEAPQNDQGVESSEDWQQLSPTVMDSGLLRQRNVRLVLVFAIAIAVFLIGLVLFIVLLLMPASSSGGAAQAPQVMLNSTPLPTMVLFARLHTSYDTQAFQPGQPGDAILITAESSESVS
jgi:predicted RNA-binding Zn-ribbon protein involved in translation (DUF1610 family)